MLELGQVQARAKRRCTDTSAIGICLALWAGCPQTPAPLPPVALATSAGESPLVFEDQTSTSGIAFTYHNGEEAEQNIIVESIGGGVGMLDYDRDGQLDVFYPGGGTILGEGALGPRPCGLFRQIQPWKYSASSEMALLSTPSHFSHGCAVADYDNDGFPDVMLTGFGGTSLYRNLGDGTYEERAIEAGVHDPRFSTSAAWGDLDGDGNLDLYLAHYVDWSWEKNPPCYGTGNVPDVCPPREFEGLDDRLYRNRGDGTFEDGSSSFKLLPGGKGLGVLIGDIDLDGDSDIYVANDTTENRYYVNESGKLSEQGLIQGVALDDRAVANGSMGVDMGDFDRDGRPDLWVANYEQELFALYRNEGELGFQHVSRQTGIGQLGDLFVGFGTAFGDLDLDGDEDLMVSNGHVIQTARLSPIRQLPLVLRNVGGQFERQMFQEDKYMGRDHLGRGLALGDLDRDGDLDVAISHNNEAAAVLENQTKQVTGSVILQMVGTQSNRDAIGTTCEWTIDGKTYIKTVCGGRSYLSSMPYEVVLPGFIRSNTRPSKGLLTILWPSGRQTSAYITPSNEPKITVVETSPLWKSTSDDPHQDEKPNTP